MAEPVTDRVGDEFDLGFGARADKVTRDARHAAARLTAKSQASRDSRQYSERLFEEAREAASRLEHVRRKMDALYETSRVPTRSRVGIPRPRETADELTDPADPARRS